MNESPTNSSLGTQVGGDHYKDMAIQPIEYIHANKLGFIEGAVVKYVSRWRNKDGIRDLRKARHFLDMLIELEERHASKDQDRQQEQVRQQADNGERDNVREQA